VQHIGEKSDHSPRAWTELGVDPSALGRREKALAASDNLDLAEMLAGEVGSRGRSARARSEELVEELGRATQTGHLCARALRRRRRN
jgi:hypothetical protein